MKKPREILLGHHASAQRRLDALRRETVDELARLAARASGGQRSAPLRDAIIGWREFIWSLRGHLAALGTAWVLIAVLGADVSSTPFPVAKAAANPQQLLLAAREHRRQLTELLTPAEERVQQRARSEPAQPRSQYQPSAQVLI